MYLGDQEEEEWVGHFPVSELCVEVGIRSFMESFVMNDMTHHELNARVIVLLASGFCKTDEQKGPTKNSFNLFNRTLLEQGVVNDDMLTHQRQSIEEGVAIKPGHKAPHQQVDLRNTTRESEAFVPVSASQTSIHDPNLPQRKLQPPRQLFYLLRQFFMFFVGEGGEGFVCVE